MNKIETIDIRQFYEDSLKFRNILNGMVIIITEDKEIRRMAPKNINHQMVAQEIFDLLSKDVNFSKYNGDFGNLISEQYNAIFIRMSSILNGPTIIYCPEICTKFQIEKLKEFNNIIKEFNSHMNEKYKQITVEYNGKNEFADNNLDNLISGLKEKNKITK